MFRQEDMKLEKNEYTTSGLLDYLREKYKCKLNGKMFTTNDVAQYIIRGMIPHRYGGEKISAALCQNVRIITVHPIKGNA